MLSLKSNQTRVFLDEHRFIVLVAGRRWAKTTTALAKLFYWAYHKPGLWGYFGPTYKSAKTNAWEILKSIVPLAYRLKTPNESELSVTLKNGSIIRLFGVDNAESLRGMKLAGGIADEYDQWKREVFEGVLRPAISDSEGPFWIIGSPSARQKKLREKYEDVQIKSREIKNYDWTTYKFKSIEGGYIPLGEIEKAKTELDERTFREEYEASFEDLTGQVYYGFSLDGNVRDKDPFGMPVEYNPHLPVRIFWDFNVDPLCVGVGHSLRRLDDFKAAFDDVHVFDEFGFRNSNTPEMCRAVIDRFKNHKAGVYVYGDATGNSRNTASSLSDYQIIFDAFKNLPGFSMRVKNANPNVKDRVNAVNSKLRAYDGKRHVFIHPRCKRVIKDMMNVVYKEGTVEIDKSDLKITHISDALGYWMDYDYPVIKSYVR